MYYLILFICKMPIEAYINKKKLKNKQWVNSLEY